MKGKIIDDVYFVFYTHSEPKCGGGSRWYEINETISRVEKRTAYVRRRPYLKGDILFNFISEVLPFRLDHDRYPMHTRIEGRALAINLVKVRTITSIDKLIKLAKIPSNAT